MPSALHRKLLRDLVHLRGQVITIAPVIAGGIAFFVAMRGNFSSLLRAQAELYTRRRFADVFVSFERAPIALRIEENPDQVAPSALSG